MNSEQEQQTSERSRDAHFEHSPAPSSRALTTMAVVRWLLLGLVTALAGFMVWTYWGPKPADRSAQEQLHYYCPMHPQIRSAEPGVCPICHMNLEPIPGDRRHQSSPATSSAAPSEPRPNTPSDVTGVTLSEEKQKAVGLATSLVESATLGDRLRVPGVIATPEPGLAQVRVRAAGFVEKVVVRQTGARVSRGQPLAFIYSPEIYRAQEEFLAANRWQRNGSGEGMVAPIPEDLVAAARRALELLGLQATDIDEVVRTGAPIRAVPVRAPTSGVVTRFNAVLGTRAEPETLLYEIADLSTVWVIASVHEHDLAGIRAGMAARFTIAGNEAKPQNGRVELIEPLLNESTRTARLRISVLNRNGQLRPGQFGEVEFELAATPGLFVRRDAVIRTGEKEYVYVALSTERFEPRLVQTGMTREGRVQVLSGLSAGDRVVTRGSFVLDSESRLQASLASVPRASSSVTPRAAAADASCETEFDPEKFAQKYANCRNCERQHAEMSEMIADCKNSIPRPWR